MRSVFIFFIFYLSLLIINTPSVPGMPNYGGIAGNSITPPYNTSVDTNLTHYYHTLTATGNGTYWFVGGWGWFNETEMVNLPAKSLLYDISPYDCESYGCGDIGTGFVTRTGTGTGTGARSTSSISNRNNDETNIQKNNLNTNNKQANSDRNINGDSNSNSNSDTHIPIDYTGYTDLSIINNINKNCICVH